MKKIKILIIIFSTAAALLPHFSLGQEMMQMPQNANDLADSAGLGAWSYVVQNVKTGAVVISKNADAQIAPASLTKLVTALVVLDTKPKLTKKIAMTAADQQVGACSSGGGCIKSKPGVQFTIDGLFHAALLPSANNAAAALARSTGLNAAQFAARMNKKVQALGATHSHFNEPTGMDSANAITASDYAKIVATAFANSYLQKIDALTTYNLQSPNNHAYDQTIKNTDKLLGIDGMQVLGAKTGYLDSYNFAALLKYQNGPTLAIVVLGEQHMYTAFSETQQLAALVQQAQSLFAGGSTALASSSVP